LGSERNFGLRDADIQALEVLLSTNFSAVLTNLRNKDSSYLPISRSPNDIKEDHLENRLSLAVLQKQQVDEFLQKARQAHRENSLSAVVAIFPEHTVVQHALLSNMTVVAQYPKGHRVLELSGDSVVERKLPFALKAYYLAPRPVASVFACRAKTGHTMQFRGELAGAPAKILLDSGATLNFVSTQFAQAHGLSFTATTQAVTLGDTAAVTVAGTCEVQVTVNGFKRKTKFYLMKLMDAFDVILGEPWLQESKAVLDWGKQQVKVLKGRKRLVLLPVKELPANPRTPNVLSALQVKRCLRKDSRMFLATVSKVDDEPEAALPEAAKPLVEKYSDVFQVPPAGLPPDRGVGHTIPLEQGAVPPFRPMYRLSPSEREEA
jgi:hypothetical protein